MKDSDLYETPPEIFNWADTFFHFELDACAERATRKCPFYFTPKEDGLKQDWSSYGNTWINPPYSDVMPWVKKAIAESHNKAICMLVRHDPSTEWFQTAVNSGAKVWDIPFRIRFFLNGKRQGTYNFPCCFLIFLPEMKKGEILNG